MEEKYFIKYVAREILGYKERGGLNPKAYTVCYYVSQAYLLSEIKEYQPDGSFLMKYGIDFCNEHPGNPYTKHSFKYWDRVIRDEVFDNYDSCKEYVEKLNCETLRDNLKYITSETREKEEVEKFNKAIKYAEELEKEDLSFEANNFER